MNSEQDASSPPDPPPPVSLSLSLSLPLILPRPSLSLPQRVLRGKKDGKPSPVAEESSSSPASGRKTSIFTDMMSRNRKASTAPSEVVTGGKVSEGVPRVRKGSMFTDLMTRNKKVGAIPENKVPDSPDGSVKSSGIAEEVSRWSHLIGVLQ